MALLALKRLGTGLKPSQAPDMEKDPEDTGICVYLLNAGFIRLKEWGGLSVGNSESLKRDERKASTLHGCPISTARQKL